MKFLLMLPALLLLPFAVEAKAPKAPTFRAVAKGNRVTIFYKATTAARCSAKVDISYLDEHGQPHPGTQSCQRFDLKPGKEAEMCHGESPDLVGATLTGPVVFVGCEPLDAK